MDCELALEKLDTHYHLFNCVVAALFFALDCSLDLCENGNVQVGDSNPRKTCAGTAGTVPAKPSNLGETDDTEEKLTKDMSYDYTDTRKK